MEHLHSGGHACVRNAGQMSGVAVSKADGDEFSVVPTGEWQNDHMVKVGFQEPWNIPGISGATFEADPAETGLRPNINNSMGGAAADAMLFDYERLGINCLGQD